jgi:hypothetical protein
VDEDIGLNNLVNKIVDSFEIVDKYLIIDMKGSLMSLEKNQTFLFFIKKRYLYIYFDVDNSKKLYPLPNLEKTDKIYILNKLNEIRYNDFKLIVEIKNMSFS